MKQINIWRKTSYISAWICGIIAILLAFFRKYLGDDISYLILIETLLILIYLFSELMKFIIKRKNK
jgi:hypothetical protein